MRIYITKFILLTISILINCDIFSQTKNQVDFYFSPTLSYRKLKESHGLEHKMGFRYDLGVNYQRQLSQKVFIGTGLGYAHMGYNYPRYIEYSTLDTIDYIFYRDFIELPLLFNYTLKDYGRNKFQIDLNLINQLFIREETKVKQSDKKEYEEKLNFNELRKRYMDFYNVAILFGITYHRDFEKNIFLKISPFFKYGILSLDNIHDWSVGLKIGIGHTF